jgi:hypothetical protein
MGAPRGPSHPLLPHGWGYDDDALLAALVVEYGANWHFLADTLSSTAALAGVTRRSEWCKQRHHAIMKAGEAAERAASEAAAAGGAPGVGPDGTPIDNNAAGGLPHLATLSKQQAKELIMRSLPVPEATLKRHADAIAPLFAKKKAQLIQVCHLLLHYSGGGVGWCEQLVTWAACTCSYSCCGSSLCCNTYATQRLQ